MGGWGMAVPTIGSLLVLAAIIVGIVLLVRHLNRGTTAAPGGHDGAERLLAERYARGDIDEQEYRQRLSTLRGGGPHA